MFMKKKSFLRSSEGSIASYNYTDIADGTGVRTFYLCVTRDSSATDYILTQNRIYSNSVYVTANFEDDFDLTAFNLPMTVKGTAVVNMMYYVNNVNNNYIEVQVRKYNGSAETNVSSTVQSANISGATTTGVATMKIPLTQTSFKRGDILRLHVKVNTTGGTFLMGTDPLSRADPATPAFTITNSFINLPFRIDL